jgi:hypothetical protein
MDRNWGEGEKRGWKDRVNGGCECDGNTFYVCMKNGIIKLIKIIL